MKKTSNRNMTTAAAATALFLVAFVIFAPERQANAGDFGFSLNIGRSYLGFGYSDSSPTCAHARAQPERHDCPRSARGPARARAVRLTRPARSARPRVSAAAGSPDYARTSRSRAAARRPLRARPVPRRIRIWRIRSWRPRRPPLVVFAQPNASWRFSHVKTRFLLRGFLL